MQTLLLMISLLLHLVTFVIIRSQSEKMAQVEKQKESIRKQSNEMEELLSTYLYEMKEENDRVIDHLQKTEPGTSDQAPADHSQRSENLEEKRKKHIENHNHDSEEKQSNAENKSVGQLDVHSYSPPVESMEEDVFEQSVPAKVCFLYNEGKSVEEIARELDCGKTEVELMLKFHRENSRFEH